MASACPLTQGFSAIDCSKGKGGIEEILITEFVNVASSTITAGEVTALGQEVGTDFHRYELVEEVGGFDTTETHNLQAGSLFYETVLNFTLNVMEAAKSEELKLAALNRLVIIIKDNNGRDWCMGLERGANKAGGTNTASSGVAFGDLNGYTLGFTSKEGSYLPEVQAAVISGLSVS